MRRIDSQPRLRIAAPVILFLMMTAAHILRLPAQGAGFDVGERLTAAAMPLLGGGLALVWLLRSKRFSLFEDSLVISGLLLPWRRRVMRLEDLKSVTPMQIPVLRMQYVRLDFGQTGAVELPLSYERAHQLHQALLQMLERNVAACSKTL